MGYSIHLTGVYLQVFFATSTCRDALEVGKRLAGGFKHFSFFPIFHKSTRSRRVKYRMFMFVGMFFNTYFKRWSELKTVLVHRQISSDIYKFATIDLFAWFFKTHQQPMKYIHCLALIFKLYTILLYIPMKYPHETLIKVKDPWNIPIVVVLHPSWLVQPLFVRVKPAFYITYPCKDIHIISCKLRYYLKIYRYISIIMITFTNC